MSKDMSSSLYLITITANVDEINQDCQFCYNFFSHNDILKTVKIIEKVCSNLNKKNRKPTDLSVVNVSNTLRQYGVSPHIMNLSNKEFKKIDFLVDNMVDDIIKEIENDLYF